MFFKCLDGFSQAVGCGRIETEQPLNLMPTEVDQCLFINRLVTNRLTVKDRYVANCAIAISIKSKQQREISLSNCSEALWRFVCKAR